MAFFSSHAPFKEEIVLFEFDVECEAEDDFDWGKFSFPLVVGAPSETAN